MSITNRLLLQYLLFGILMSFSCQQGSQKGKEDIADLDFYHESIGEGPPIIVIHGGPGLGSSYLQKDLLPLTQDHQVIFYDQINSGRSRLLVDSSRVSQRSFLRDIDDLRKSYGLKKVSLLGHSWGGLLGMKYALLYPNNVDKLILVNSSAADSDLNNKANTKLANQFSADDIEARTAVMRSAAFQAGKAEAYEEVMNISFAYQFSDRNLINNLNLNLPEDFAQKSQQLAGLFRDFGSYNFTSDLQQMKCETLLLFGLDDPSTPLVMNSLSNAIPGVTVEIIDDAGHFPFVEKPEETIQAIGDFIQKGKTKIDN